MGRLAGFTYRDIIARLKVFGFQFHRQAAGSHEIWHNEATNCYTTIPNHPGDMPEGTLRAILKQAHIPAEDFSQFESEGDMGISKSLITIEELGEPEWVRSHPGVKSSIRIFRIFLRSWRIWEHLKFLMSQKLLLFMS